MSSDARGLAAIDIAGCPYDIGFALGRFGRDVVHDRLVPSPHWREIVVPARDNPRLPAMLELVRTRQGRIHDELRGLADGLALPFTDVFAWNCRGDLRLNAPDGCTTVQLPGEPRIIAHNEDGLPAFDGFCALATVRPDDGPSFTAFVYPGSIPGHTFSVNEYGLVQTINNVRCESRRPGVPRMVLTRAMLDCAGIDEAVGVLTAAPRAGGFHVTLAQAGDARIVGVEFDADAVSAVEVDAPAVHANHLVHAAMVGHAQRITASSASRQQRAAALLAGASASTAESPTRILFDAEGALPVRRRAADDPDHENTLATAVFVVGADRVDWTVYDGRHRAPVHSGVVAHATAEPARQHR